MTGRSEGQTIKASLVVLGRSGLGHACCPWLVGDDGVRLEERAPVCNRSLMSQEQADMQWRKWGCVESVWQCAAGKKGSSPSKPEGKPR